MSNTFLSIRGLNKQYGNVVAIDHVSLEVKKGEFMTFLGPSGSGKSTTLYIVAGFQDPTEGQVLLGGESLLKVQPNRRNIGMVFQRYTLFPHLTVGENVAFPLRVRGKSEAEIANKVDEMLKLVHLKGYQNRMPSQLSGGQQQRVAIARALAYDPPLLLMDEPLSALDKKLREELQFELRRIHQETGVTILYVTHDQEEALRLSDRIAVFNEGRIEQCGTGEDLYERPETKFVAGFIGNSNFLPVKVSQVAAGSAEISFPDGSRGSTASTVTDLKTGGEASLMIRPDRLTLAKEAGASADQVALPVTIKDTTFLGDSLYFAAVTPWNQEITVRTPMISANPHEFSIGDQVFAKWHAEKSQIFSA